MKKKILVLKIISTLSLLGALVITFLPCGVTIDNEYYSYFSKVTFSKIGFIPGIICICNIAIAIAMIVAIFLNKRALNISIGSFMFLLTTLSFVMIAFSKNVTNFIHPILCLISFVAYIFVLLIDFKGENKHENN